MLTLRNVDVGVRHGAAYYSENNYYSPPPTNNLICPQPYRTPTPRLKPADSGLRQLSSVTNQQACQEIQEILCQSRPTKASSETLPLLKPVLHGELPEGPAPEMPVLSRRPTLGSSQTRVGRPRPAPSPPLPIDDEPENHDQVLAVTPPVRTHNPIPINYLVKPARGEFGLLSVSPPLDQEEEDRFRRRQRILTSSVKEGSPSENEDIFMIGFEMPAPSPRTVLANSI